MSNGPCRWGLWIGLGLAFVGQTARAEFGAAGLINLQQEHRRLLQATRQKVLETPYLVIDTHDNRLLLRQGPQVRLETVCATGSGRKLQGDKRWHRWVFDTPKGRFSVLRKVKDPLWVRPVWDFIEAGEEIPVFAEDPRRFARGVLGEYALYFARNFMIHGTLYEINLGNSITHGCVRVGSEALRYLYENVELGWPVFIY